MLQLWAGIYNKEQVNIVDDPTSNTLSISGW